MLAPGLERHSCGSTDFAVVYLIWVGYRSPAKRIRRILDASLTRRQDNYSNECQKRRKGKRISVAHLVMWFLFKLYLLCYCYFSGPEMGKLKWVSISLSTKSVSFSCQDPPKLKKKTSAFRQLFVLPIFAYPSRGH